MHPSVHIFFLSDQTTTNIARSSGPADKAWTNHFSNLLVLYKETASSLNLKFLHFFHLVKVYSIQSLQNCLLYEKGASLYVNFYILLIAFFFFLNIFFPHTKRQYLLHLQPLSLSLIQLFQNNLNNSLYDASKFPVFS